MTLDYLIHSAYVVTMEGPGTGVINHGAVGIKDNKIAAVGESSVIRRQYSAHREIDASAVQPFLDILIGLPSDLLRELLPLHHLLIWVGTVDMGTLKPLIRFLEHK